MSLTKSQPNNIQVPSGNGLAIYIDANTGQVFLRDVRGATQQLNVLMGLLDGTGNPNFVPKFIDPNTLGDSQIFDNGTNVGIGTTNPTDLLHVAGGIQVTGTLKDSSGDVGTSGQFLSSTVTGTNW
jgi:hypothetical protein